MFESIWYRHCLFDSVDLELDALQLEVPEIAARGLAVLGAAA